MINDPTLGEVSTAVVGFLAIFFCLWSAADDWSDTKNVRQFGSPKGPRAIAARGNLYTNLTLIAAWSFYVYLACLALYLPPRPDIDLEITERGAWARFALGVLFLIAQTHHRIAREKLRRLPRQAWIEMIQNILKYMPENEKVK